MLRTSVGKMSSKFTLTLILCLLITGRMLLLRRELQLQTVTEESWTMPWSAPCTSTNHDFDNLSLPPGKMNQMRRMIALSDDSSCYSKYLLSFVNYTVNRIKHVQNHLNLHIPKTGGTSICTLVKQKSKKDTNFTITNINGCWEGDHFLPLWCNPNFIPGGDRNTFHDDNIIENAKDNPWVITTSCNTMDRKLPTFVMNENYLDHPLCTENRIYSTILRNPIERVASHERHLLAFGSGREHVQERLELVRNNYMVWALSSGTTKHGRRLSMIPLREHLQIAKNTLLQFDYIFDFTTSCRNDIIYLMGLPSDEAMPHQMKGIGKSKSLRLSQEEYEELNLLDVELYDYAQSVMKVDCDFFSLVRERMDE